MELTNNFTINFRKERYEKTRDKVYVILHNDFFSSTSLKEKSDFIEKIKKELKHVFLSEYAKDESNDINSGDFPALTFYFEALGTNSPLLDVARCELEKQIQAKQAQYFNELWNDIIDTKAGQEECEDPYAIRALERAGFFDSDRGRVAVWG